jgi:hypothetical protein
MCRDEQYQMLVRNTPTEHCADSHEVVAYWMMQMNTRCGAMLANACDACAIYRMAVRTDVRNERCDASGIESPNVRRFVDNWRSMHAEYTMKASSTHDGIGVVNYVHITSPIRRIVDIINQFSLMRAYNVCECRTPTIDEGDVERINEQVVAIKRVQTECDTLYKITTSPEILDGVYEGIVIENNGTTEYVVYLTALNLAIRVKPTVGEHVSLEMYSKHMFRVYLFKDECKMRRKIRWVLQE